MPNWTPTEDALGKARIKAYQTILQNNIAALSTALSDDSTLSFLISDFAALDSTMVKRGDFETEWTASTGCLRMFVSGGGHHMGIDMTAKSEFITEQTPGGKIRMYQTSVFCYFHPDAFRIEQDPNLQAQVREDAFQTVQDWMDFACFGTNAARDIALTSHSFNASPGNDRLLNTIVQQSMKVFVQRGKGDVNTYTGLQMILVGMAG